MSWAVPFHLLLSTCGPAGVVPDAVCNVVGGIGTVTQDIAELIQNPFRWLYHHTLGIAVPQAPGDPGWDACQKDWTQQSCPKLIDSLNPGSITLSSEWPRLYGAFAVSGMFIAATACVVRVVRGVFDAGMVGMHLVVDNVTRLVVVSGVLLVPSPDHSLLLAVLTWSTAASGDIAAAAATTIAGAFNTRLDLGAVMGSVAGAGFGVGGVGDFLIAIPILLAALAVVYILALYLLRVIQLVFAVATAPIFIGLAVYDHRSRFVQWWLDLFTSAMVLPVALSVFGSLTGAIALLLLGTHPGAPGPGNAVEAEMRTLLACFAILGGVWMTGKAVHGLAWRGFSHGGITGAVTAASTSVMALPNLAGHLTSVVRTAAAGVPRAGRTGGMTGTVAGAGATPGAGDAAALVAAAAAGKAAALGARALPSSAVGDFGAHPVAAHLLRGGGARDAFNHVVSDAVTRYAGSDAGRAAVQAATSHLEGLDATARVSAYTRMVADDPGLGNAVAGAALAGLLHNQEPDIAAILEDRAVGRR